MGLWNKIIAGGDGRVSRFHTERNEMVPMGALLREVPLAAGSKLRTLLTGRRPSEPWWPYPVIDAIDKFLSPHKRIIEFGSGSSTTWLARRGHFVLAVESDPEWLELTRARIADGAHQNATVVLRSGEDYWTAGRDAGPFDLAIVDGLYRWRCLEDVLGYMNPGGLVYLDNADADKDLRQYDKDGMRSEAQGILERFAERNSGARLVKLKGMISGEAAAGEGWLLFLP